MGLLRRVGLFVFGVAGLVSLAVLVLPELGIAVAQIGWLMDNPILGRVLLGCVCVTAVGLAAALLAALFAPRNARSVVVSTADGDQIQVSRDAIRAQAVHIIEADGSLTARNVSVRARRRGHVRVKARVQPQVVVNVAECGDALHSRLVAGLAEVCGGTVDRVEIEFVDAVSHEEPMDFDRLEASYAAQEAPLAVDLRETPEQEGITVPMGHAVPAEPSAADGAEGGE